jgi:hypothetical protein
MVPQVYSTWNEDESQSSSSSNDNVSNDAHISLDVNEGDHHVKHLLGLAAVGLEEVEDVCGSRPWSLAAQCHRPPHHDLGIRATAPLEEVHLSGAHEHPVACQHVQPRCARLHGVHPWAIHATSVWVGEELEIDTHGARPRPQSPRTRGG